MIDDEFETVFRRMIEHLMGAMGEIPDGNTTIRYWTSSNFGFPNAIEETPDKNEETDAEVIQLDDKVLVIINLGTAGFVPSVRVEEKNLIITNEIEDKETILNLDFLVDVENSHASYRNGILEVELKEVKDGSDVITEGELTFMIGG
ncbi:hypothetical protein EU527_08265 [Candidatus Thorarchaeota archaeon]|nr:MAG: hypothetical protein EU527_08265 [Candidatus Thorarchaeota archaeon]